MGHCAFTITVQGNQPNLSKLVLKIQTEQKMSKLKIEKDTISYLNRILLTNIQNDYVHNSTNFICGLITFH